MALLLGIEDDARKLLKLMVYSKFQLSPGRIAPSTDLKEIWHEKSLGDERFPAAMRYASGQGWVEERRGWVKLTEQGYFEV